jgi:hypothetical protein
MHLSEMRQFLDVIIEAADDHETSADTPTEEALLGTLTHALREAREAIEAVENLDEEAE